MVSCSEKGANLAAVIDSYMASF